MSRLFLIADRLFPMSMTITAPKFSISMKKLLLTLVAGIALATAALAQPAINIIPPFNEPPCNNETFCVDVEVVDFTDILSMTYVIQWDPAVLQYNNTGAYNLSGLSGANFTQTSDSTLLLEWLFGDCANPAALGNTIADGTVIYEICFTAIGQYGDATQITIPATANPPSPDIKRKGAGCTNIGIAETKIDTALISTCVDPFVIDISDGQGNEGDLVCIDFRVFGFDELTGFQFPIVWDPSLAEFVNIVIPGNLPNLAQSNFGTPGVAAGVLPGSATVSWSAPTPQNGISVPDSTLIFQLCLRLKSGSCSRNFKVAIGDQQPGQPFFEPEAANNFGGGFNRLAVGQRSGRIFVGPCNPTGLRLTANCGAPVNLNEQVCVQVLAGNNFQNVTTLQFLMEWNQAVLAYTNTQNPNLPGGITFNASNAANGVLGMSWTGSPTNRAAGDVLFEVCFDAVGLGGNSPFIFVNQDDALGIDVAIVNNNNINIGINPTNCEVTVNQPDGIVLEIVDGVQGRPGDTVCFDFEVSNFTEVTSMQFSLSFETLDLSFLLPGGIQNLTLPGANNGNFGLLGVGGGQITFNWTAAQPVTLADGTRIFSLCFEVVGNPGDCDEFLIVDAPLVAQATTATSGGDNVGLTGLAGSYCILSPEGFYLEIGQVQGDIQDTICVPVKVSEFDGIISGDFCINWAPGNLELIGVNDGGFIPSLNVELGGQPVGNTCFSFNEPGGLSLPDSTVIFEMCFRLLGPGDTCYTVAASTTPQPVVETVNGPGSLLDIAGRICVNPKLFLTIDSLRPESCPGARDGYLSISVEGGSGDYIYSWEVSPPQFTRELRFLSEGCYVVTVRDRLNLTLAVTDTFCIPSLGGDLFVNIGADRVSSCDPPCTFISPMASQGPTINYQWTATQGGQVCSPPNDRVLLGRGPGTFILRVTDTATGCSVQDTVRLLPPILPLVDAGETLILTCENDQVELLAPAQADTVRFTWFAPGGSILAGPAIGPLSVMVSDSGMYQLQATIIATGCSARDSVLVTVDRAIPIAIASPGTDTTFLGCNDVATLIGFAGDNTDDYTFRWLDAGGNVVATTQDYMTDQVGTYTFEVTNTVNGCVNTSSTTVVPDAELPVVAIQGNPRTDFGCNNTPVRLQAVVTNANPNQVLYQWAASGGAVIQPGTANSSNPTITSPGTLQVTVTNPLNGCTAMAMIEVGRDTTPPLVSIALPDTLTCVVDGVTLDATSSDQGSSFTYRWRYLPQNLDVDPTDPGNPLIVDVGLEGTYLLQVTDTLTGCTGSAMVEVVKDTLPPTFEVIATGNLNCENETIIVRANVDQPFGTYAIEWQTIGGNIVETTPGDTLIIVDAPGAYVAVVTSTLTGCFGTQFRNVEAFFRDDLEITIPDSDRDLFLNCLNNLDTLDARGSTVSDSLNAVLFQWNVIEGAAPGPFNQYFLPVDGPGVFEFVLIDQQSRCAVRDTIVVDGNFDTPIADAGNNFTLVCSNTETVLDGSGSTTGPDLVYTWERLENLMPVELVAEGPDAIVVPIDFPGLYRLTVTNTLSGCSTASAVLIDADGIIPQVVIGAPTNVGILPFDCTSDTVAVSFSILPDSIDLSRLSIEWSDGIATTSNPFEVLVYQPGIFTVTVTDTINFCVGVNEIVVEDERDLPAVNIANTSAELDCETTTLTLNGAGSAVGGNIVYQWIAPDSTVAGENLNLDISAPGLYRLVVSNTENGCVSSEEILVTQDVAPPPINFEQPRDFQCRDLLLTLDASASGPALSFEAPIWQTIEGGQLTPVPNSLTATINGPGTYQLTLVSALNGCDSTVIIEVAADTMAPVLVVETPALFGCTGQTVSLDASQSGSLADFESITWAAISGGGAVSPPTGALAVSVNAAGTYRLTVASVANGCEASQEIVVSQDPNVPMAVAAASAAIISCGEDITLDGSQSSQGDVYSYQWVVLSGTGMPTPPNAATSIVAAAGTYQLIVTNTQNNCADTSAVLAIELDPSLVVASAVQTSTACGTEADISGNGGQLPAGVTGQWMPLGAAVVADNTNPIATVSNLATGVNLLVWSLSQDGCPNYSTDTLMIVPEQAPIANDDVLTIPRGFSVSTLNLAANDVLDNVSGWTIDIIGEPFLGSLAPAGLGSFTYNLLTNLFQPAEDEFAYRICNELCPTLCDEALVQVIIERDSVELQRPNAITPNGDGLNDALVFDELLLNPEKFPDNELIIFNRWGDIVYKARPYNNDWQGQNNQGADVPDGTYYYILRLTIGKGEIIRGDVTVIR
jgi:gliding motility-associated-like protein